MHHPENVRRAVLSVEFLATQFPRPVGCGLRRLGDLHPGSLFEEEEVCLSPGAVTRRREHFALGRAAAHDALAGLGLQAAPIPRGEKGEPLWPESVIGAISHTGATGLAVAGRQADYAGIGLDIEALSPGLGAEASHLACTRAEADWVAASPGSLRRTMLFCAKEAIFKALYPIEHVWLDLLDAELTWAERDGAFEAILLTSGGRAFPAGFRLRVSCCLVEDMVLASTFIPAPAQRSA